MKPFCSSSSKTLERIMVYRGNHSLLGFLQLFVAEIRRLCSLHASDFDKKMLFYSPSNGSLLRTDRYFTRIVSSLSPMEMYLKVSEWNEGGIDLVVIPLVHEFFS
ncbi:hypothetical protein ACOME3_000045 [Neoechinorhynchus agilis]